MMLCLVKHRDNFNFLTFMYVNKVIKLILYCCNRKLQSRDLYVMKAISVYLQSKFELASINTRGPIRVHVRFATASERWRRIIWSNVMQSSFVSSSGGGGGRGATDIYEKIQKVFGNDSLSRAQVFRWHRFCKWARNGGR
jgi:hypothetical protein